MVEQRLFDLFKLVFILDLSWYLRQTQVVLEHFPECNIRIKSEIPEDRLWLVEHFHTVGSFLAECLPLFVSVNHWLADFPTADFDANEIHLYIGLLVSFYSILAWKHEMFALSDEEEKVLSRSTEQIRLHFDIVNVIHLYVLNILDYFALWLHLHLLICLHNLQFVLPAFFGGPSYLAIARYLICLMTFTLLDGVMSAIFDLVRHYAVGWRALVSLAFGCL